MDNQPILSTSTGPFASGSGSSNLPPSLGGGGVGGGGSGSSPIMIVIIVILGLGALIFGVLTITYYGKAQTATKVLDTQKIAAAKAAQADQKKTDDIANALAAESPFRSYIAPDSFGSFEIKFPKDWSSYVDQESYGTQVSLVLNPDFVRRTNSTDVPAAARVMLIETPQSQYMQNLSGQVKNGTITQADITVSGQPGFNLTGAFSDKKTVREVVIPVRDKVLVFTTEDNNFSNEFNEILAQSKIIP